MTLDQQIKELKRTAAQLGITITMTIGVDAFDGVDRADRADRDTQIEKPPGRPPGISMGSKWHALRMIVYENPGATAQRIKQLYNDRWKDKIAAADKWRPEITNDQQIYDAKKWVKKNGKPPLDDN